MVVGVIGATGAAVAGRWLAVGATIGSCGVGAVMPVGAAAPSAFLFFLRSRLFLLLPFFFPPSFAASSFPTSSCCCLTGSASGASPGKLLVLVMFDRCSGMDEERKTGVKSAMR